MKLRVKYTNKTGIVGYGYIDLRTSYEEKMLERGRELGATFVWIGKDTVKRIKYDDKHSDKRTERGLECEGIKK